MPSLMIRKRIEELEQRIDRSETLSAENKAEILGALADLKREAATLPESESAAVEPVPEEASVNAVLDDLTASVASFESSHPRVTALANRVAVILSNMGI